MSLLDFILFYVVAAVLVFQGTHAFGEQSEPMGVVPEEVTQDSRKARLRGGILATYGYLCLILGLLSHLYPTLQPMVVPAMAIGLGLMTVYGLCVIFFNRVVKYQGVSSSPAPHDHA